MYQKAKLLSLIAETPVHAGSGSDLGIVDLPIQRERHTGFPKIEGSSLKGAIREAVENLQQVKISGQSLSGEKDIEKYVNLTFGPEEGELHAGALGFTDARLLLFPVKSMKAVFIWVTCPRILARFCNDLKIAGFDDIPEIPKDNTVPQETKFLLDGNVILEDCAQKVDADKTTKELAEWIADNMLPKDGYEYWVEKLKTDLVVLPDTVFTDFVTLSTEVITRTKINNKTGTVQKGALFTEEFLPTESILYSLAMATPVMIDEADPENTKKGINKGLLKSANGKAEAENVLAFLTENLPDYFQLGGDATLGKGFLRRHFAGSEAATEVGTEEEQIAEENPK